MNAFTNTVTLTFTHTHSTQTTFVLERESEPSVQNRTEEKHLHGKIALLR